MTDQAAAFQPDPRAEALGRVQAHLREAVYRETGLIAAIGQPQVASAVNRAILGAAAVLLSITSYGDLRAMADRLDAEAAELAQRQAEVNAAHPEDGTVLPEAQPSSPSEDALASPSPADTSAGEGVSSPVGGSDAPSAADQQSPGPTDTAEGASSASKPAKNS